MDGRFTARAHEFTRASRPQARAGCHRGLGVVCGHRAHPRAVSAAAGWETGGASPRVRGETMHRSATPTLFQQALGAAYFWLAPCVRHLHGVRGQARYRGITTIERGANPLANLCARAAGLPTAGSAVPTTVVFDASQQGETWQRDFGGRRMTSNLAYRDGLLHERLGIVQFRFWLHVGDDGALWWQVAGVRLFGILPLPQSLFDGVRCREREHEGRYEFLIDASLPLMGRIVRYEGWLEREDGDDRQ